MGVNFIICLWNQSEHIFDDIVVVDLFRIMLAHLDPSVSPLWVLHTICTMFNNDVCKTDYCFDKDSLIDWL